MADNEITDIGVMSGIPYGTAPLSADVQYLETYTSSALNRKLKGIVLPGFYMGFSPVAGTGLNVVVTSKDTSSAQGAASIDVNAHQITIQHIADLIIPVIAGKTTRIVLEANYKIGTKTDQVDTTSTVRASRVFAQDLSVALAANQLELCRVIVPTGTTQITQPMIVTTYRVNRQVGLTLDSIYTSDSELIAANLKGLKVLKGLIDTKLAADQSGSDIADKAAFRKNIGLDKLSVTDSGILIFEGAGGFKCNGYGAFTADGIAVQLKQKTADKAYFIRGRKADDKLHWYLGQSTDGTDAVTWGNSIANTWYVLAADGTGESNVSGMTFRGDLKVNGLLTAGAGAALTGPVNVFAKGTVGVGDLTNSALYVCGNSSDGTQGITVNSFAPTITFIDRSASSAGFRWRGEDNYLRLDVDNRDNGVTWNQSVAQFSEKGLLTIGGGEKHVSRMLTLGSNTAGNKVITGTTQIVAMTYANIGADATARGIGFGAEMAIGDGATAQTMDDWVEFWANSNIVNTNANVTSMSSFRSYDKASTSIANVYAFDGRQTKRAGVNRWNLFMQGSAPNFISGQTIIGGTDTKLPDSGIGLEVRADSNFFGNLAVSKTMTSDVVSVMKRISIGSAGNNNFNSNLPSINIGDTDSGIIGPADGTLDIYCSNVNTARFTPNNLRVYGPVVSEDANGFRIVSGNRGVIHRFDGSNYYLLITAANDSAGSWNTLRPFAFNANTGEVSMNHYVRMGSGLTTAGNIGVVWGGRGHTYQENGDIVNQNGNWTSIFQSFGSNTLSGALSWVNNNSQNQLNDRYHAARFTNVRGFSSSGNDWGNAIVCFVGDFGASDGYGRVCDLQLYKNNAGWLTVGIG